MCNTKWWGILLLVLQPPVAFGQVRQHGDSNDPRLKRELRERAVAAIGPIGRDLVETHGEEAVAAIFACTEPMALKLAEFHAAGELKKLPRPKLLLAAIGRPNHGDDVASFAMQHSKELADEKRFQVFLADPLTYAMSLKSLDAGVAEFQQRLDQLQRQRESMLREHQVTQMIALGILLVAALTAWRFRHRFRLSQM